MATDSSSKLTKFISAETIVTADFANSIYGGLFGTTEGDALDEDDPRVAGHIHDGENADGHAGKIDLVSHVTNQLRNTNLGDQAVTVRNMQRYTDQNDAIPISEVIDGTTYYYLDIDLSSLGGAFETISNVTANTPGDLSIDDFVFGSSQLDDDGDSDHDNRIIFDKSIASFRAGAAQGSEWDLVNRGSFSFGAGFNNVSGGNFSSVAGGSTNIANTDFSSISGGQNNVILNGKHSFIGGGGGTLPSDQNRISTTGASSSNMFIGGGKSNQITGTDCNNGAVCGGISNKIESDVGGSGNVCTAAFIGGGETNEIEEANSSSILGGSGNKLHQATAATAIDFSAILGGVSNEITRNGRAGISHGDRGWSYMQNQHSHGGGEFDNNSIRGQAQTSVLVVWGDVTTIDTPTDMFLDGTSARLFVNEDRCVFVKISWVYRVDVTGVGDKVRAGERICALRRDGSGAVTVVGDADNIAPFGDTTGTVTVAITAGATAGDVDVEVTVGDGADVTGRFVGRVEWTEVYQEVA